jgi:response regulator receiver domain-containing protein
MTPATTWDEHVLQVVDEFLQTVVVVDDRAFADRELLEAPAVDDPPPPQAGGRAISAGLTPPLVPDEHDLDPKAVTDAFAEDGLVCTLLSPKAGEEISGKVLRTARRADLVVLDWVFDRDEGKLALELIGKILAEDDQPTRRRLRTIAVYTGQKDLHGVAVKLRATIDAAYTDCELVEHESGLAMTKGPVRAAVFAKEHVSDLPADLEPRRVAFAELPTRLRNEFAALTAGLVTTVALASLAALREDTHRILSMLGPALDAAFLGHRAALPVPEDAESHAVALVVSELRSVIEDNDVGRHAGVPALELWLRDPSRRHTKFGTLIDASKRLTEGQLTVMLSRGLGDDDGCDEAGTLKYGKAYFKSKVKPHATRAFAATMEESNRSDHEFASRMMLRTIYSRPPRILALGVIVRAGVEYKICVQPVCDSVRLSEKRAFPFLTLVVADVESRTNFVVAGAQPDQWVRLLLGSNPRDITMAEFDPGGRGVVEAVEASGTYIFTDVANTTYEWVGELKPDLAQKVAIDLAQQFAQVAVDEAEVLRLSRR